jgi:hypothetical protein
VLHKFQADGGPVVADSQFAYTADRWHPVELIALGGHIQIVVDSQTVLTYDDPDPLPPGAITFENGDPPARHLMDDVVVEPANP